MTAVRLCRALVLCGLTLGAAVGMTSCAGQDTQESRDRPIPPPPEIQPLTVGEVLAAPDSIIGKTVSVRGLCTGWRGDAVGPSPLTRSDWQLRGDEAAIWVSGPLPRGCAPVDPPPDATFEIVATVAIDTVSVLGQSAPVVRRFLRRVQER